MVPRPSTALPSAGTVLLGLLAASAARAQHGGPQCLPGNGGLSLPPGFCALVVGENLGPVRHLVVAANGDLFAAVEGAGGGVLALRDTSGNGVADVRARFGPAGGTGIALADGYLYFGTRDRVVRWPWRDGQLVPGADYETIVEGLPGSGSHAAKSLVVGPGKTLYVNLGSASNSCQRSDRESRSPGLDPCAELEGRAGIWRFAADRPGQRQPDGTRFATGIRNAVALALEPGTGRLFFAMMGRDQLGDNWGYPPVLNAELPAEEFGVAEAGADYGWPYCYYDQRIGRKVLAPEYGGDGGQAGRCADKRVPLIGFPGHWAPLAIVFYRGTQFPASYREGAFIAFHGSWNRAPLPQEGFRVVFVPFTEGTPTGRYTTFAAEAGNPTGLRASGLAVGPDGSLYIAADRNQKIWRVMYRE